MVDSTVPNDPLLSQQWHLAMVGRLGYSAPNDISGLARIWADYRGSGVHVGIWDEGVETGHWDLDDNYDPSLQVTVKGTVNDGTPSDSESPHGTSVAGLIGAENNGLGGVGIAYQASLTAVRIFGGQDDINEHWSRYLLTLNSLSDFDVTNHSYGAFPNFVSDPDIAKFAAASANGRGGLGTINFKSAGNDSVDGNGSAVDASRFTITVAALATNGNPASYSSYGAHILVSAPAGEVTTDRIGDLAGYNGLLNGDYTDQFGGTSAASPISAAVATLMLDANPDLGWRDIQNILSYSALGTGSRYGGASTNELSTWAWNGADNWNGGGLHFSEDYGYGMINAFTAVRMAEVWSDLHSLAMTSSNEKSVTTGTIAANLDIADASTTSFTFDVSSTIVIEHVDITISLKHAYFSDLDILLVSPDGTEMTLYDGSTGDFSTAANGFKYTFGADGYRGELSAGTWQVRIVDNFTGSSGTLDSVKFTAFGSRPSSNDVYHYTDEALAAQAASGQGGRITLTDNDGGTDWIDAAAMFRTLMLNLAEGASSTLAGTVFMTIASGTLIENAIAGDGNDTILGNALDNLLAGMRGNDTIEGGDGSDTVMFKGKLANYAYVTVNGVTTVTSKSGKFGTDTLTGVEFIQFQDKTVALGRADFSAPTLVSSNPVDNSQGVGVDRNITLTFSEAVVAGTGSIYVYRGDGTLWDRFDISDPEVSINGRTLTLNPTANLDYENSYYVTIDSGALTDTSANPFAGLSDPKKISFTTAPEINIVNGNRFANILSGTAQVDHLFGFGDNDTLKGLAGNDILDGGNGEDEMSGGMGDDVYIVDNNNDRVVEMSSAGSGTDQVQTSLQTYTLGLNVENLDYTGSLRFTGKGNGLDNIITGGAASDVLQGEAGNDDLDGEDGGDIYIVTLASHHQVAEIADSGASGIDEVRFATAVASTLTLRAGDTGIERVVIGTGTGVVANSTSTTDINVDAAAVLNSLQITGNNGDNILTGSGFADTLIGLGGKDVLLGGVGSDLLRGGLARDTLTGGTGSDIFMFDTALGSSNVDTITDFTVATDLIRLENTGIFTAFLSTGALAAGSFNTGTMATEGDDRIIYDPATGNLIYDADGTGGSAAILFAILGPNLGLSSANFDIA